MANYFETTLLKGIKPKDLGNQILDSLSFEQVHSVEVIDKRNRWVIRVWESTPYDISKHSKDVD